MTIKEALSQRHTVRRLTNKPIPEDVIKKILERIEFNNRSYNLRLIFVTEKSDDFPKITGYLLSKNIRNYIVLAGAAADDLDERLGYCGADMTLYLQTLGLNTWWIGGGFDTDNNLASVNGKLLRINGVIGVGYGQDQGIPHISKKPEEISSYEGTAPQWFKDGVAALLLAPTAMNRQAYNVYGKGRKVNITCSNGYFSGIDLGIGKYHFELGAGKENFDWI